MAFEANKKTIYDLLNDISYSVPLNQRKYVWKKNNWTELFDDIQSTVIHSNYRHFLGSVVLNKIDINDNIKNHCSIVDGQQRIITVTIALVAIGLLFAEAGDISTFNGLTKNILVKNSKGESSPIISRDANKDVYELVNNLVYNVELRNNAHMPPYSLNDLINSTHISSRIRECLIYFYDSFKYNINNNGIELEDYLKAIQEICYINIVADNEEDAYSIFESLNARGQPLEDFDLLSNFILKQYDDKDKPKIKETLNTIRELTQNVELYLKHYVTHKYGEKTDKNENRPYKIIIKNERSSKASELLADLLKKAIYYSKIISYSNCSPLEYKVFSFFKPRRQQQFRPIVLGLMHKLELNDITLESYENAIYFLYIFFVYFNVIGDQTSNKIEDIVYSYSYKIENELTSDTLQEMRRSMSDRIPEDKENLFNYMKNLKYSHNKKAYKSSTKRENVKAVLEIIEKEKGCTLDFDGLDVNIEHIINDGSNEDSYLIGNLMLLERTLNDECKNKTLDLKADIYKKSKLMTPHEISGNYKDFNCNDRFNKLVEVIYSLIRELKDN